MYRNYIFDFYGTLADIRTDEEDSRAWETLALLYGERGAVYLPGELRREFLRLERCETDVMSRGRKRRHACSVRLPDGIFAFMTG